MDELMSALLGAVVASVGGFIAIRDVTERQTRRSIAASLAAGYMARFSEPAFMEIRDEVDILLAAMRGLPAPTRAQRYAEICRRASPDSVRIYNRLHALAMLFAEIGVAFQRRLVDVDGLAIFDRLLPYYWSELTPYIAATHAEFGFRLDPDRPLEQQQLVLFSKFAFAYNEMKARGIAREPADPPTPQR